DDTAVYGDKGYASGAKKRAAEAAGVLWGGEGEGQTRTPADGSPACPQSPLRESLREGRTCVPCHEVPVRLPQGALSRPRQERRTGGSRCWRSPTCTSPAARLRARDIIKGPA